VKEDDTSLHSWNEYRFPHFEYRKPQRYSTGRGSYSSSYSPYRDFPTLPSPLNRALPHQRRPHHIKHTHRVQTIIEMDEQSTTSEEQLHEVAHYGTLDGRPGALEYSGFQWLQNRPAQPNVIGPGYEYSDRHRALTLRFNTCSPHQYHHQGSHSTQLQQRFKGTKA